MSAVIGVLSRFSSVERLVPWLIWALLVQMDLIVGSENGKASSTDILNSVDTMITKKLKKSETEHLLNRLVQDKWLNEVKHSDSVRILKSVLTLVCFVFLRCLLLRGQKATILGDT